MTRATDCPVCPRCALPCGVTYCLANGPVPAPGLKCAACGHRWDGTAEERAQAERADAAWEIEWAREGGG